LKGRKAVIDIAISHCTVAESSVKTLREDIDNVTHTQLKLELDVVRHQIEEIKNVLIFYNG